MRTITTCAGIGDFIWIAQKLINAGEKFNIIQPDGLPQRGHQIMSLLPNLVAGHSYASGLNYKIINNSNAQAPRKKWSQLTAQKFFLSANSWLENGRRIEQFLPDLPTSYKLDYTTTEDDQVTAEILLPNGPYIGIYSSAYKNARHEHYNGWGSDEWVMLIKNIHKVNPEISFVIIGAEYDADLSTMIMERLKFDGIKYVDTVGQPLSVVVELLKRLSYFIGFPSGLSILNESMEKNGLMFYGTKIKGIINTWASPERIKNGNIKECLFTAPDDIFQWLKNQYLLFDKITV